MREESHLEDMRAALRGDFERLTQRRGKQVLLRPKEPVRDRPSEEEQPPAEPTPRPRRTWIDRLLGL